MSDTSTLLQLQEARRALAQCVGERDRSRAEARRLRGQLRQLREELLSVRPVELTELLEAKAQTQQTLRALAQAQAQQQQAQTSAQAAQDALQDLREQLAQRDKESEYSLMRVLELREQLLRARSTLGMQEAAVRLLRGELERERSVAQLPAPEQTRLTQDLLILDAQGLAQPLEPEEAAVPQPQELPPEQRESPQVHAQPAFDLPEGTIWEFKGMAEPQWFYRICSELAARKLGNAYQIGHFEQGDDRVVVVMGSEGTARPFLEAFWQDEARLMASLGLPLIRVQPSSWCSTHWDRQGKPALPQRFAWWRDRIVRGELHPMHEEE